jgi:hypothetical protein
VLHHHSRKTARDNVKIYSVKTTVLWAIITGKQQTSGVLTQSVTRHPDRMNIHLSRNSLIRTAYATVLLGSRIKCNTRRVLVSYWPSPLCESHALWSTSYPRLTDSSIKYATEPTAADWISLQSRSHMLHKLVCYGQGVRSCCSGGMLWAASTPLTYVFSSDDCP